MNNYSPEYLEEALKHCRKNKDEILQSSKCICINCKNVFNSSEITEWGEESNFLVNAICPHCRMTAVIGSQSALPLDDEKFLVAMYALYKSKTEKTSEDELYPSDGFRSHHRGY